MVRSRRLWLRTRGVHRLRPKNLRAVQLLLGHPKLKIYRQVRWN